MCRRSYLIWSPVMYALSDAIDNNEVVTIGYIFFKCGSSLLYLYVCMYALSDAERSIDYIFGRRSSFYCLLASTYSTYMISVCHKRDAPRLSFGIHIATTVRVAKIKHLPPPPYDARLGCGRPLGSVGTPEHVCIARRPE